MSAKEFADVVLDTNILHSNEIALLFKFFNSSLSSPLMFSKTPRQSCASRFIRQSGSFQPQEDLYGGAQLYQETGFKSCGACGAEVGEFQTFCLYCGDPDLYCDY